MTGGDKLNVEEKFPITKQGYTVGKLSDSTECQMLLDTGASKSFMSKSYYCIVNDFIVTTICFKNTENSSR